MRRYKGKDNAKDKLMSLVQRLANTQNALIRSRRTQEYYKNIQDACETHLHSIRDTGEILTILGWSLRLMRYYHVEPERAVKEQRHPQAPQRTLETRPTQTPQPPKEPEKSKINVGDKVKATILKNDRFKVTVQLQTKNNEELVFERAYYPGNAGAQVKLRVQGVNENGHVTKVIP